MTVFVTGVHGRRDSVATGSNGHKRTFPRSIKRHAVVIVTQYPRNQVCVSCITGL